jgi:hypothetical protein
MADRVDTVVDAVEAAPGEAAADAAGAQSELADLGGRNDPVLPGREVRQPTIEGGGRHFATWRVGLHARPKSGRT